MHERRDVHAHAHAHTRFEVTNAYFNIRVLFFLKHDHWALEISFCYYFHFIYQFLKKMVLN